MHTVQSHLDALLRYLQPHMAFVNCHMVGYLTENLWQTHVPEAIRSEVQSVADVDAAVQLFWDYHRNDQDFTATSGRFGGLVAFLRTARAHRLSELQPPLALTAGQMEAQLQRSDVHRLANSSRQSLQIKEFMSEKKSHEVEIAAQLVAALCAAETDGEPTRRLSVIDAGDGKGYLSSRLALEHRLTVLGIDANEGNTMGSLKRSEQLEVNNLFSFPHLFFVCINNNFLCSRGYFAARLDRPDQTGRRRAQRHYTTAQGSPKTRSEQPER